MHHHPVYTNPPLTGGASLKDMPPWANQEQIKMQAAPAGMAIGQTTAGSEIQRELETARACASLVSNLLNDLSDKLGPVLSGPLPVPVPEARPSCESPLAEALQQLTIHQEANADTIRSLLNRICL